MERHRTQGNGCTQNSFPDDMLMQMLGVGEKDAPPAPGSIYLLCEMWLVWRGQRAGLTLNMAQGLRHPASECPFTYFRSL